MALQNAAKWAMSTFLGNTYYIPDYQREYSWEEELGDFWDDLEMTKNDSDETIHFFGQIVVHVDKNNGKNILLMVNNVLLRLLYFFVFFNYVMKITIA